MTTEIDITHDIEGLIETYVHFTHCIDAHQ